MKTKKFSKKLVLKKESIANLNANEMKVVQGRGTYETYTGCCACLSTPDPCYTNTNCSCPTCQDTCPC